MINGYISVRAFLRKHFQASIMQTKKDKNMFGVRTLVW